ncbi:CRISPR-associated CARF protein Csa3 [Halobacterium hubeiense]|uniref:CRISPR-associated CARF protein Csa3 n=2 Tax=Halobacterium hubeiense TaxID=1407499 RepID=UPI00277D1347|nr:CRISPR-associated CARF protein Csa3 [Halobacterium hubeiense]
MVITVALFRNSNGVRRNITCMRTYLAPLGFDSRRVVRPVLSEGLDESDRVVLLQPANSSDQSEDAFEEVVDVLTQVVPDLELDSEQLPYTDFVETTLLCADLMQAAEGETIVVLGGGAREILLPLTVATFSNENHINTILQVGDIDSSVRRIPQLNLRGNISNAEATLLADLTALDTPLSISEIATELEKSKSTVARHVDSLESEGFVQTAKEGRTKTVEQTDSGRVFLSGGEFNNHIHRG